MMRCCLKRHDLSSSSLVCCNGRHGAENGGEGGIRTHGTIASTTVFETAPFDHSGTSPHVWSWRSTRCLTVLAPYCKREIAIPVTLFCAAGALLFGNPSRLCRRFPVVVDLMRGRLSSGVVIVSV